MHPYKNWRGTMAHCLQTFTMFDGKIVKVISGTEGYSRCTACGVFSSEFGDLKNDFTLISNNLKLGLPLLHCELRSFKFLLNLSYRLYIKQWTCGRTTKRKLRSFCKSPWFRRKSSKKICEHFDGI